jgi:serine/threonine protein kinase
MAKVLLDDRYDILAEIGRGERTVTYKARDVSLNRTVVVKILEKRYAIQREFVDRFQRAAQAMAGLSHHNIAAVYDIGSDKGIHYLVTEYVEGQNLESSLASKAPLTVEQSLDIAISVCTALGTVHQAGFVHGQLTPRNILLTEDRQVKVSDFGVVDTPAPLPLGEESPSRYTGLYLSPEQAMGRRAVPSSDVYTVGVILYEMLTGHPPFDRESFSVLAEEHIREEPEPLHIANPQVPRSLSVLVHRALVKTSTGRYRTAAAFKDTLIDYRRQSEEMEVAERIRLEEKRRALERLREKEEMRALQQRLAEQKAPSPVVIQETGPDWAAMILAMVAFIAVLGLIPLWVMVFLRYFS